MNRKPSIVPAVGVFGFLGVWGLMLLANLVFWGGVLYVAAHFIMKWW
jgi:hypothetical protein